MGHQRLASPVFSVCGLHPRAVFPALLSPGSAQEPRSSCSHFTDEETLRSERLSNVPKVKRLREKPSWDSDPVCLGSQFPHPTAGEPLNTDGIMQRGATESQAVRTGPL